MAKKVLIPLEIPTELERFALPPGVGRRLQELLDKQDKEGPLNDKERSEAEGLVEISELQSLLKLRSTVAGASEP